MSIKQLFGIIGSFLLIGGVFCPIVKFPIVGGVNYFQNGQGDGTIILIFGVLSLLAVLFKQYRALWLTGFASLGMIAFTAYQFHIKIAQIKAETDVDLADNPFRGLADLALQSVQLQWGIAVIGFGAIMVIIAAAIKINTVQTQKTE